MDLAIDLANRLDKDWYYDELEALVLGADLDGIFELCKIMRHILDHGTLEVGGNAVY